MLKRMSMAAREENYEHVLMCLICRSLFDDFDHQPKFLPCHHTFCKDCLREYVRQFGDEIECPSCRKIANIPTAGVTALQTNFYVKYIQGLVSGGGVGPSSGEKQCSRHSTEKLHYFCRECEICICKQCSESPDTCKSHDKIALTRATEESHQSLDTAFSKANLTIESKKINLEKTLKALAEEKDQALVNIDSTFDQHTHTIQRRGTLLKNKVIAIYNEHKDTLENDLEEISTALTCIVSIKDYHEEMINEGSFKNIQKGLEELEEVNRNIGERIQPAENHIVFEANHGVERFKGSLRDLGRVRCSRPIAPRSDPEGNAGEEPSDTGSQTSDTTPCMEVKPFSSPELQSPLDGAYAMSPPDVTVAVAVTSTQIETSNVATTSTNTDVNDVMIKQVPKDNEKADSKDKTHPSEQNSPKQIDPTQSRASKMKIKQTTNQPTRKPTVDVKPKGTNADTKVKADFDANQNCHIEESSTSTTKPTSKFDLCKFSRETGNTGRYRSSSESDRQNGNIVQTSRIPTTRSNASKASSSASDASRQNTSGGQATTARKYNDGKKSENVHGMHPHGAKGRSVHPECSKAPPPHGGSLIAQAIAASSHDRQPNVPHARPDSLLKPGACHNVAPVPATSTAPAMPDLLPESVLKVMQSGTDDEKLRAEKEYYHLLYTSYDEEELLRELKSGAAPAPSIDGAHHSSWSRAGRTSLEDSDNSWLTTSSASEESEGNTNDENDILAAPDQTTV